MGYRTIIARYVAKWGIACASVKLSTKGGGIAPFWGSANLHEKVSRDMGYRSDSIAVSRDMGPLSLGPLNSIISEALLPRDATFFKRSTRNEWDTLVAAGASLITLRAQRLKKINLDWSFQSRLNFQFQTFRIPHKKWGFGRLKISISIENFNPGGRSWIFSILGPLG